MPLWKSPGESPMWQTGLNSEPKKSSIWTFEMFRGEVRVETFHKTLAVKSEKLSKELLH